MTSTQDTLQSRLEFIGLDEGGRARLADVRHHVEAHLSPALEKFYEKLSTVPEVTRFFEGKQQMNRAQGKQVGHWQAIAAGQFDDHYFEASTRVGLRHAQIGLEPRWHIGGYGLIMETLVRGLVHDVMAEAVKPAKGRFGRSVPRKPEEIMADVDTMSESLVAVLKAMLLDIDIGVSAYFRKLSDDARASDDAARAKIRDAVEATGTVLTKVAEGDLTHRVTAELDPEFDEIKDCTNAVVDRLTSIVSQLQDSSRSLKNATGEILAGANDLADRTTRQAATIEQTSASVEQLTTAVADNAKRASAVSEKAHMVARNAMSGGETMNLANEAMSAIEASSSKISNIIGLIDDIAFQTNLLALNASVEAARAGEAGKGFAVVAVEVRRLAQSAANASSEVKQLIEASAAEVRNGTALVSKAAETLQDIVAGAEESASLIDSIAQANRLQSDALSEVSVAVRQMDEMTQHNAALVEETNAAIEQTEGQANELDRIVDVFYTGAPVQRGAPAPRHHQVSRSPSPKFNGNAALQSDWEAF